MSPFYIILVIAALAAIGVLFLRKPAEPQPMRPTDLQPGPIQHESLPDTLVARIRKLEPVFAEVYPQTHEQWLDGFQRDADPESEVAIWESMAAAYQNFTQTKHLSLDAKREAFGLLLVRSAASEQQTLAGAKFEHLSHADAEQLLHLYSAAPQPVQFEKR
ncbi:MAG TPA: hypothetical protein VF988_13080 [Verrucomicrobiae bacterium]